VTARLRDARFFWEADRRSTLDSRIDRLGTLQFHKKLGSYKEKAERIEQLAAWIAEQAFGASKETAAQAARAARLAKADLTTDMVREFTELQGTMGGIYARHQGEPEEIWKAMYFHYLPIGVEADAPPTRAQLGKAAVTWASVSLADKLDTMVGLFAAGEKPTGSRDPFGLRRAAQGVIKILTDVSSLSASAAGSAGLLEMIDEAAGHFGARGSAPEWRQPLTEFLAERETHLLERRGFRADEARAVVPGWWSRPQNVLLRVQALAQARKSPGFETLAILFKRVKNITKGFEGTLDEGVRSKLTEPAERALLAEMDARRPAIDAALASERYGDAMRELGVFSKPVDQFFVDVLVMAEDPALRNARLTLLATLRRTILDIADISEIAPEETKEH
jgi:glycyl-tRNA synthetase beta chain